jgi:peptidoglycan hydrolase-like protein with peptidoglycan-binding domain
MRQPSSSRLARLAGLAALGTAVAAIVSSCSSTSNNNLGAGSGTTVPVSVAQASFCDDLASYLPVLDQYGKLFQESQTTIGDLQTAEKNLVAGRAKVQSSATELATAVNNANRAGTAPPGSGGTTTTVLASKSPDDHIKAITSAENDFSQTLNGVDAKTPVTTAAAEVQAAAFEVEQAYVSLFVDAGCLSSDAQAAQTLNTYTTDLQKDLTTLGVYTGPVDGLYGPATIAAVKSLQKSAGLPQTGIVDPATESAINQQLAAKSKQQSLNIAALQGVLTAGGFYTGPIDGNWTPEVESAVKAYQTANSLPPTGSIDVATLTVLLTGSKPSGGGQAPAGSSSTSTTSAAASSTSTTKGSSTTS